MLFELVKLYILIFYFIYKLIEQKYYIDLISTENYISSFNESFLRLLALIVNFTLIIFVQHFVQTIYSKRKFLAIYTSGLIMGLQIFKHKSEFTFFLFNLNICEALLLETTLNLWHIQLCIELAILANYLIKDIPTSVNCIFLPMYLLWIFSILIVTIYDRKKKINKNSISNTSCVNNNNKKHHIQKNKLKKKIKNILFYFIKFLMFLSYILISCTTTRNTLFLMFKKQEFKYIHIVPLMILIYTIISSSYILLKLSKVIKLIIILTIICSYYAVIYCMPLILDISDIYGFIVENILNKIFCLCKCCLQVFLFENRKAKRYKGVRLRLLIFFVLNSDTLSFFINTLFYRFIDLYLLNIIVLIVATMFYTIYTYI